MATENTITKRLIISGLVQGVGFRYFIADKAHTLKVNGYTQNEPSGNVIVVAQGQHKALDTLKGLCQKGPTAALIENITEQVLTTSEHFDDFSIRYA